MRDTGLTAPFEAARPRLRAVAYRMLGSVDDAEDAVQEAWLRLNRDTGGSDKIYDNIDAWLTTVVARICLNMLRARRARREEALVDRLPDPIVDPPGDVDPEHQALLADSVGVALFVVLDTLPPDERLAFVLHDVFAVPFDEIAPIVDRTTEAARKLASRARHRIQQTRSQPDRDVAAQREIVEAFFAAGRAGDFERLVSVLHPTWSCAATSAGSGCGWCPVRTRWPARPSCTADPTARCVRPRSTGPPARSYSSTIARSR